MSPSGTTAHSQRWLSGLNFFLADVRDGLGPFLGVFLMGHGWRVDEIGYLMTAAGLAGMLATTPLGAWVDASRRKRSLLAGAIGVLIATNMLMWAVPSPAVTAITQVLAAAVGALFGPAIMGLTLGMVGPQHLASRLGLNEAWNHAGNVAAAVLAGLAGYVWGLSAVFVLMVLMAGGSLLCLARIRPQDIDHDAARGLNAAPAAAHGGPLPQERPPSIGKVLLDSRDLLLVAVAMMLFHLGNAAMLPLLSQSAVAHGHADPSAYTALAIIVAQLVMIPVALVAGRFAARHGYWPLVACALLALPLRGLVAAAWLSPWALIPVQVLDGIGAGLLGVALPGLVASILHGSGHVNVGLGAVMAVQGIGAAFSPALGGWVAHRYGYGAAFAALSVVAVFALVLVCGRFRGVLRGRVRCAC